MSDVGAVALAVEAEKLGLDVCWVAEAWGSDAPSALGYLAALTDRMLLGSGVVQVGTRSPVVVAQTAITLSNLSNGRFLLVIGTEQMVRARLAVWKDAGVNTVRLYPAGDTLDAKLSALGRAIELARDV